MIAVGQFTIIDLNDITVSATAPTSASEGQLWLNTSTKELKQYVSGSWVNATKYTDDSNLTSFIKNTYNIKIEKIEEELEQKIITWYYSGEPTLLNQPADNWNTSEERDKHIGDIYFDKDTGYVYLFQKEGTVYSWKRNEDKDLIESMALAGAAKDTADNKRRVFLAPPFTPYDNGDLWLNDGEIYVCQISKPSTEEYADGDFIIATKYTDDTLANQVNGELTILSGTVSKIKEGVDEFKISFETTTKTLQGETKVINETLETMSYSFGTKDLRIANSSDPVNASINNQGLKVYTFEELETIVNHNGLGANKLIVTGDAQLANIKIAKAIDEDGNACTDFHHLISKYQTLQDLED